MSELRAPDPTLTELPAHDKTGTTTDVGVTWLGGPPATAHRLVLSPEGDPNELVTLWPSCDHEMEQDDWAQLPLEDARWFAVPCRECFPDTPPPGKYPFSYERTVLDDANLAWQVPS